tara:strand:- start:10232 stop:10369 length:138 start_codon:yes stop_codon:yes gene_type:complete
MPDVIIFAILFYTVAWVIYVVSEEAKRNAMAYYFYDLLIKPNKGE